MSTNLRRVPVFAVVGRVNEGKSSIVAALTEGEDIAIGPEPGTTRHASPYALAVDGRTLVEIVDTPGFQQPEAVMAWLEARARTAADRPAAVRAFLEEFRGKADFEDECELLQPVMDGASIIYVVDASHPFRTSYECEMQILRWTGRPCVALLNRTGREDDEDFSGVWKAALKQYFDRVQLFNAHANRFEDRIKLLSLLAHLIEEDRAALDAAVAALHGRDEQRLERSAGIVARMIAEMLSYSLREPGDIESLTSARRAALEERYAADQRRIEARARDAIESLYSYKKLDRLEGPLNSPAFEKDLFAGETWQCLGLSRSGLVATGAASGAVVGGMIDAAVAGHSFFIGTLIGAGLGAAGSAVAALREPEARLFGASLAGSSLVIGPHRDPQFPWVLLDRALLHQRAVARRPHSVRAPLALEPGAKLGVVSKLDTLTAGKLKRLFDKVRKQPAEKLILELKDHVAQLIRAEKSSD